MPSRLVRNEATATDTYAQFVAEPFDKGYGHTIGNSLRRVLLSSLAGASITSVKIRGAEHEFTTLPGVLEDVVQVHGLDLQGLSAEGRSTLLQMTRFVIQQEQERKQHQAELERQANASSRKRPRTKPRGKRRRWWRS